MRTGIIQTFKNISHESIDYSTKPALIGLNGVDYIFILHSAQV